MRRRAVLLALLLAGCATGNPRPAQVELPPAFEARGEITPVVAIDRWWTLYDDPQLTALVDEALERGFSVREALARLDEARGVRRAIGSQFGPQGDVEGSVSTRRTYNLDGGSDVTAIPGTGTDSGSGVGNDAGAFGFSPPGRANSLSLSLPVRWELDLWGRIAATRRYVDADLAAAGLAFQGARTTLAADVAEQLFQARGLNVQLDDARETLRIRTELRRVLDIRAQRGLAPRSDVDRVETDIAIARAEAERLEAESLAARRALLALLGRAGDRLDTVAVTATLGEAPPVPAGLPADLLVRRPDVAEARVRLDAALGRLRTAELAQFPTITLTPSAGVDVQRGVFDAATSFWSIGAGLVVPLLDRRRLRAELDQANARTEQAVLTFERTVQAAYAESDQLIARLSGDRRRVAALTHGEARGRAAYNAAVRQYGLGLVDLTTLLDVESRWRSARQAAAAARLDALSRSVQLFKALGGGWSPVVPRPTQ